MSLQVRALEPYYRISSIRLLDPAFFTTFLMMYKSFTTLDEFFNELVRRFFIPTPDGLSLMEVEEWRQLKQYAIQIRYVIVRSFALC
jgi:son of sevenless-like protein